MSLTPAPPDNPGQAPGQGPRDAARCPDCGGTGWRMISATAADAPGALPRAQRCACQLADAGEKLAAQAAIPARYKHCTLENFATESNPGLQSARLQAATYVKNYPGGLDRDRNGLVFAGPPGTGKTHLAVAIAQALLERDFACRFCDYRDLLKRIQATFDPANPATESTVVQPLLAAEILILDDLGVGRATEWAQETLHYLLNHRYSQKLPTIITTNLPDADSRLTRLPNGSEFKADATLVDAVGARLRSRLNEMCVFIPVLGSDFRRQGTAATRIPVN